MRNTTVPTMESNNFQSIRCSLLGNSGMSTSSLMNSAENALAALGTMMGRNNNQCGSTKVEPDEKMLKFLAAKVNGNGGVKNGKHRGGKVLHAQIARLQMELEMQTVRYQSTVAEFRRCLAYVSARQPHTPHAVEQCHVIRIPLDLASNHSSTSGDSTLSRKLGFSVLPDGTVSFPILRF